MLHLSTAPLSNIKLKRVPEVYHVLYNDSAGKDNISKCQRKEEFTRTVHALLYYIYITTYNIINCNCPCVLIRFHTQRRFRASLSTRVSDSGHPVTYFRKFCTNKPYHRIYRLMSVLSTWNHTLIHNPTVLHTKNDFAPSYHLRKIYHRMSGHSTRHHTLLHNPMIIHRKTFFVPACHLCKKILST